MTRRPVRHLPRRVALVAAAWMAATLLAVPAHAGQASDAGPRMIDRHNTQVLAEQLRVARRQQGVCYGWDVTLDDNWQSMETVSQVGSNRGVGTRVGAGSCNRWAEITIRITWTNSSSEQEDSAVVTVDANFPLSISRDDLSDVGITEEKLVGENDKRAVYNAIVALPQLVAAHSSEVSKVPSPQATQLPASADIAGSPDSDWVRTYWFMALWALGLIMVGVLWVWVAATRAKQPAVGRHAYSEDDPANDGTQ